jgi:hypothetical protein
MARFLRIGVYSGLISASGIAEKVESGLNEKQQE